uniref:C-type lectin domain-containing protein n=2 Tax=Neogobius melanostomus TaxID=47308 RepID=A0A8C6S7N2_9GOBI
MSLPLAYFHQPANNHWLKMHVDFFALFFLPYAFREVFTFHEVYMEYYFIDLKLRWSDAQQYCREHYTDLATVSNVEDLGRLTTPSAYTGHAWIGLIDDPASWKQVMGNDSNSWRWSATGTTSPGGIQKWHSDEPNNNNGNNYCVYIKGGLWADAWCGHLKPFACFTGTPHQSSQRFTLVTAQMSWEDARIHCRQHHTDLAMIEAEAEFNTVASLYPSTHVWVGLYREPWRWSDGSQAKFTNWANGQPDNYQFNQHCVKVDNSRGWHDENCQASLPFHCEKGG